MGNHLSNKTQVNLGIPKFYIVLEYFKDYMVNAFKDILVVEATNSPQKMGIYMTNKTFRYF